jgi:SAM-dependent methyltransferase
MRLHSLPFHIGPTEKPDNPCGLPNTYPFEVVFDSLPGMLVQPCYLELEQLLQAAYEVGQAFGTPLAEDSFGRPYAEDFLEFIKANQPNPHRGLEIGAGVGYLSRLLLDLGWDMTSLEPGKGYQPFWKKYDVTIIEDFFPSPNAAGPYSLICSYGVLEHISDSLSFLRNIKDYLAPGGKAIFAVPDCTDEILSGDPSILFHEHFNYFEPGSLNRLFKLAGLNVSVVKSGHGRCLYAVATLDQVDDPASINGLEVSIVESYPERCLSYIERIRRSLSDINSVGTLGLFCAARSLTTLDIFQSLRFFDDDPLHHGKFFPPFQVPIEGRQQLINSPVDQLVIMSRTFGHSIRSSLREQGYQADILTLDEL